MATVNVHAWLAEQNLPLVERVEVECERWYRLPGETDPSNYFASVTNVLSVVQPKQLTEYYKRTSYKKQTETLEQAVGLGTFIHELIDKDLQGIQLTDADLVFKPESVNVNLKDFYKRWIDLRKENEIEATILELPVVSTKHGIAGTADIVGTMHGKPTLFDLKSGHYSTKIGWQLSGYREAYKEMTSQELDTVWLSVPWNKPMKLFPYEHYDWCWARFLDSLGAFKGLYYTQLDKMKWRYLHVQRNFA